jgi:predicted deacylase
LIRDKSTIPTKLSIITGAHHGNEYLNIADRLPALIINDIANKKENFSLYFQTGGVLLITPIVNAWGYINRTRENYKGQDLNRNYSLINSPNSGFTHSEVSSLNQLVKKKLIEYVIPLVFTMDYHCCNGSRGKGALIWTNNFDREASRKATYLKMRDIIKSNLSGLTAGTAMDIVGYDPKGTSNDYWDNYFGAYALVFEGQQGKEDKKLNQHYKSLAQIFNLL